MLIAVGICIGFALGISLTLYILRKGAIGNLVITDDMDDSSYMFLEILEIDIEELRTKTTIKLNVVDKGKTPHQ